MALLRKVEDNPAQSGLTEAAARRELLEEAGLRKPWLWQAAEALRPGEASYPMTMEQFTRWRETAG